MSFGRPSRREKPQTLYFLRAGETHIVLVVGSDTNPFQDWYDLHALSLLVDSLRNSVVLRWALV